MLQEAGDAKAKKDEGSEDEKVSAQTEETPSDETPQPRRKAKTKIGNKSKRKRRTKGGLHWLEDIVSFKHSVIILVNKAIFSYFLKLWYALLSEIFY